MGESSEACPIAGYGGQCFRCVVSMAGITVTQMQRMSETHCKPAVTLRLLGEAVKALLVLKPFVDADTPLVLPYWLVLYSRITLEISLAPFDT